MITGHPILSSEALGTRKWCGLPVDLENVFICSDCTGPTEYSECTQIQYEMARKKISLSKGSFEIREYAYTF